MIFHAAVDPKEGLQKGETAEVLGSVQKLCRAVVSPRSPRRTALDCDALWGWQTEDVASAAWLSGVNSVYYVVTMLYYVVLSL